MPSSGQSLTLDDDDVIPITVLLIHILLFPILVSWTEMVTSYDLKLPNKSLDKSNINISNTIKLATNTITIEQQGLSLPLVLPKTIDMAISE